MPSQEHYNRCYADVRAGESSCWPLTGVVSFNDALIEESVTPSWRGQPVEMMAEIVVNIGEDAIGNVLQSRRSIVILRACDWQEDEDDIGEEERGENDECGTFELGISAKEIEQQHADNQWIVRRVSHIHHFAEELVGHHLREQQRRLATEKVLLELGEQMVEIRKHAVDFVGVGIPPGER